MGDNTQTQNPHIVMLPTPGMGHLIPLVEFAKRLVLRHDDFSITIILIPTDHHGSISETLVASLPSSSINYILLPPVNFDDLSVDVKIETRICLTITRSLASLRQVLKSIVESKNRVVAFVADLFGTDGFDVANELKVSPYLFYPSTAMMLSLDFYLSELDQIVRCDYKDLQEPVCIPGCMPIHGKDLPDPLHDRKDEAYQLTLRQTKRFKMAHGIILNSFIDMEPGPIKYLQDGNDNPKIYPVGPVTVLADKTNSDESQCLKWLDEQPSGSVLYVSFGSSGVLSHKQIIEIATGLEMSGHRFLWVVRCPNDRIPNAAYFNIQNLSNPLDFLPNGFLDRTKGLGLVLLNWAPQVQLLNHSSIGGFLSHCGWNSILESVVYGVPLITWPLFADQRSNAVILTQDIKVALSLKVCDDEIVARFKIAQVVKELMEGEEGKRVRNRMKELKDAAIKVLDVDGSSTKTLDELASQFKSVII
ncbi:hydroquinone glucosyltransferase [Capsicum chacoense]